jgi:chemotaxis protein methyltransferase CheR
MHSSTHEFEANLDAKSDRKGFFENTGIVNQTDFFRNEELFRELKQLILPEIEKHQPQNHTLNIWSAGCSDGREPYSLAMAVESWMNDHPGVALQNYHIRASDLNREYLSIARQGMFRLKNKEKEVLKPYTEYFQKISDEQILIASRIKSRISFYNEDVTLVNLKRRFQLIICTNVLMYYEKEFRKVIITGLLNSLELHGYIFVESTGTKAMKDLGLVRMSPSSHFFKKTDQKFYK